MGNRDLSRHYIRLHHSMISVSTAERDACSVIFAWLAERSGAPFAFDNPALQPAAHYITPGRIRAKIAAVLAAAAIQPHRRDMLESKLVAAVDINGTPLTVLEKSRQE